MPSERSYEELHVAANVGDDEEVHADGSRPKPRWENLREKENESARERKTDRQTDRQTDRDKDRECHQDRQR